jgi:hypothetical protein
VLTLVCVQDHGYKTVVMIGDGATDLEVNGWIIIPFKLLSWQ